VAADAQPGGRPDVVCPHCGKPFSAPLLADRRDAQRGYKCPHCRLFVPLDRATETSRG
jgi:DNA-directed RNA polymerase subunit RPC12/RpoP